MTNFSNESLGVWFWGPRIQQSSTDCDVLDCWTDSKPDLFTYVLPYQSESYAFSFMKSRKKKVYYG